MEKKEVKQPNDNVEVESSEPKKTPVKKPVNLKALFFFLVFVVFACTFTVLGVLIGTKVIPAVNQWLIDHNFKEAEVQNRESNSPFIPQPTTQINEGAKGSVGFTIPQVVEKVSKGVVSIAKTTKSNSSLENNGVFDTIGTGFVVESNGIVITNQHVVSDLDATYQIVTQENKKYSVKSIVRDDVNDIALLVVDGSGLTTIAMGDSEKIKVGETVIAIGTPLGEFPGSVTVGVISGLKRSVAAGGGFWESKKSYDNVIQTDAAVNPGNSGGPLLNLSAEVIGVNFATTGSADNISFALPINLVKKRVAEYKQFGKFITPYLGVNYRTITKQEATYFGVNAGALVRGVAKDSPAEKAGLRVNDIVTKINNVELSTTLAEALAKLKVGDEVMITVTRTEQSGTSQTLTLKTILVERP